ncbi:MAG: ComEA family DNA-binding protein [Bacilli bacterium]|nr:ComEA family DNA-binding protein [Bacilli bacterium]
MFNIILFVVIATLVGIVAFSVIEGDINADSYNTSHVISGDKDDSLTITITGEVKRPGTYYVVSGSTLAQALEKASGVTSNADPLAFETDYIIDSPMSFYIAPIYDNSNTCSITPLEKVNINTADKAALMNVPGFGDAVTTSLLEYRSTTSLFHRIEDIKNVPGIGEATFTKARDHIILKSA